MEDTPNTNTETRFVPTFPGLPFPRLPFLSAYIPVVPCVLDGSLSLLELIMKLQWIVKQYSDAITSNHNDIVALAEEIDSLLAELRIYIDTQDAATLNSANAYCDRAITLLETYCNTHFEPLLQWDQTPTDGSLNPVTSNGIYDAIADAVANRAHIMRLTLTEDNGTYSINSTYDLIYMELLRGADLVTVRYTRMVNDKTLTDIFTFSHIDENEVMFFNKQYQLTVSAANVVTLTAINPPI